MKTMLGVLTSQKETDTKNNKTQGAGNILQKEKKYVIKGPTQNARPFRIGMPT